MWSISVTWIPCYSLEISRLTPILQIVKSKTIFVSFESLRKPAHADVQIKARGKSPEALCAEVVSNYTSTTSKTPAPLCPPFYSDSHHPKDHEITTII